MTTEAEIPTIQQALSAVMGAVQSVSKDSRNTSQNFNFRGIDAVMNAVGPALREHGVVVVPVAVVGESENYTTSKGTAMRNVTLTVTYRFYGPAGDYIEAAARGEASDSGDKATPKAHSVAFRTLLLQALCIPTDEPDPDASSHERGVVEERRQETAGREANVPRTGAKVKERLTELFGAEETDVWLGQAQEYAKGRTLSPTGLHRLGGVVIDLEESGIDFLFPPADVREKVQAIFAARFDGAVFAGPEWAMNGAEAEAGAPSKAEVLDG